MIVLPIGRQYMQKYLHIKRKIICTPHNFIEKVEINTKYFFAKNRIFMQKLRINPAFLCKAMFFWYPVYIKAIGIVVALITGIAQKC